MLIMYKNNKKSCETCKYYKKCSENIFAANIEREYFILWSAKDCWIDNK